MNQNRMFEINGKRVKTWNPVKGCLHDCTYCWAKRLAERRLRNTYKYRDGFVPTFFPEELKNMPKDGFVFIVDMGDLFGYWVGREWIEQIIKATYKSKATFLFLTKNPKRYWDFDWLKAFDAKRHILGATIETNRDTSQFSSAPFTQDRYVYMRDLDFPRKMVSIEPIMDFDLDIFTSWIRGIKPEFVYIGYDNYSGNNLPEPNLEKTQALIKALEGFTEVRIKTLREAKGLK